MCSNLAKFGRVSVVGAASKPTLDEAGLVELYGGVHHADTALVSAA